MAYMPSLADIPDVPSGAGIGAGAGYTPTLADLPQAPIAPSNPSLPFRITGDVAAGLAGAGQGIHNFLSRALTPVLGKYAPAQTNVNFGQLFGVNAPNTVDKVVQQAAPYTAAALTTAGAFPAEELSARLAQQALGGSTYNMTQSQNPVQGGLAGMALAPLSELVPAGLNVLPKGISAVQPKRLAQQIMESLGGGRSLEENGQALAQDIQSAFKNRTAQGSALFQPVFDAVGNDSIYNGVNQANVRLPVQNFNNIGDIIDHLNDTQGTNLENAADLKDYLMQQHGFSFPDNKSLMGFFNSYPAVVNNGAYNRLAPDIIDSYDRDLTTLHNNFINNPTFQNAHDLQSQLGGAIRELQATNAKRGLAPLDRSVLQGYQRARGALRSDMNDYLNSQNPALADQYNMASAHWAENVAPYLENPKLTQIAKGDLTNPGNVASLFKNPEPETHQIVSDMGDQAKNKILYSQLGKLKNNLQPEKLVSAVENLDQQGLGSYVSPQLRSQIEELGNRIQGRNIAQQVGGLVGGVALGAKTGLPYGETIGGGLGALLGHYLNRLAPPVLSSGGKAARGLMNFSKYGVTPVSRAAVAPVISKGGQ